MTLDERLRTGSEAVRQARQSAEFTVGPPTERGWRVGGPARAAIAVLATLLIAGVPLYLAGKLGDGSDSGAGFGNPSTTVEADPDGLDSDPRGDDGPPDTPLPTLGEATPGEDDWVDLGRGVAIARVHEGGDVTRIWFRTDVWEAAPAPSSDLHMAWLPAGDGALAVFVVLRPGEATPPTMATVTWNNGVVQQIDLDWSGDPGVGLGFAEMPPGLTRWDVTLVEPVPDVVIVDPAP